MPKQSFDRRIDNPFSVTRRVSALPGTAGATINVGLTSLDVQGLIDASLVSHRAEADPHAVYLTQAEGDGLYSLLGHDHDSRYYTKTQLDGGQLNGLYYEQSVADSRFVDATGDTMTGQLVIDPGVVVAPVSLGVNSAGQLVSGWNADLVDGYHAADFPRKAENASIGGAWTFAVDVALASGAQIDFADIVEDKIYYWSNTYGLGIEASTLTNWSASNHRWRIGGTSATTGTQAMFLNGTGLKIGTGNPAQALDVSGNVLASGVVSASAGTTSAHVFGQGTIGEVGGYTSYFGFAANAFNTASSYALLHSVANGSTFLNAASGQIVYHRIANVDVMNMTASRLNPAGSISIDLGDYNRKWRTLYAAELYVETLVAQDVISTIGGRIMVAPTTTLIADLTNVATTIDVKHNNLVSGDYVYMASAPGGVAQVESMKVTSGATVITGGYRYTVTRNQDGSGANAWVAGDAVADIGGAVGSGYIDLTATSTLHGQLGPTMTIFSRTSTAAWNGVKPTVSVGNLRSFVDYSSDTFGIAHGNDLTLTPTSGFSGITSDNTNGLRLFNTSLNLYTGGNQFLKLDTTTGFTIKSGTGTSLPTSSIYGAMWYRDTLGGNKAAYIASVYDTTNPTTALRGNNLFVTSYDSPAGPSQLNIIAIDEGNAFVDMAQISMRGGKPTLSMTSAMGMQATTITVSTGAQSLSLDQTRAAFNQNVEIGTTLTVGTVVTALTATVQDAILLRHNSGLTPTNGLGVGIVASVESTTTENRLAGRLAWKWATAADATRASRLDLSTYYTTTERIGLSLGSNATVPLIGFLGTAPVAKPAAFTQTYATASRTHSNITAVNPAAYAAGANGYSTAAMAAAVHAAVIAHTADIANVKQVVNQLIDDLQAYGLSG